MDFGLGGAVFPETKTKRKFGFCEKTLRTAGQMDFVNSVLVLKTKEKRRKFYDMKVGLDCLTGCGGTLSRGNHDCAEGSVELKVRRTSNKSI